MSISAFLRCGRLAALIALACAALPSAALAQKADATSQPPQWLVPPRPEAMDFPEAALMAGASGEGVVACHVAPDGTPVNCEIVSEKPEGMGFGAAALRIVQRGRVVPPASAKEKQKGAPARFVVRVPFNLD